MQRLRTLHLFAGAGGGILGDLLLGHQPVCAVEINEYCQQVLSARQKDGCLPWFPIFPDVTQFDGARWNGLVDCVAGGFPCQDISAAGKGAGIDGERSGLWGQMARIVGEVRPRFVFVENSPLLVGRGLVRVLADLAEMGFDARWGVVGAADVGAPHRRERCWIVAHAEYRGVSQRRGITVVGAEAEHERRLRCDDQKSVPKQEGTMVADTDSIAWHEGRAGDAAQEPGGRDADRGGKPTLDVGDANGARKLQQGGSEREEWGRTGDAGWWLTEPDVGGEVDGLA